MLFYLSPKGARKKCPIATAMSANSYGVVVMVIQVFYVPPKACFKGGGRGQGIAETSANYTSFFMSLL